MAKTQDTLDRCTDLANAAFPEAGGACAARDAAFYLAHTENGESLRALAEATGTHPSTVMRRVRRVESRRDDPLVDSMLADLEGRTDAAGEKPGAREDLVNAWNEGMVYVDYVGHGSPNVWAHEDVFRRTRDLPRLFNGQRLPLVYTASCSIGSRAPSPRAYASTSAWACSSSARSWAASASACSRAAAAARSA